MFDQQTAQQTIVVFLLDRTGSMEAIKAETIAGFNAYLATLEQKAGDLVEFTWLQFDSLSVDMLCRDARLSEVPRLTSDTYQPRADTPLIDACLKAIEAAEERVAQRRDKASVIVVFQTDGEENASREHSLAELRERIERRKSEGWQFVFLGADIDAYTTAGSFGLAEETTIRYLGGRSCSVLRESARMLASVARGKAPRVRFSDAQKRSAAETGLRPATRPRTPKAK
jgi:hypothetical protein